ncbi:hypothetical protein FHX08_003461 [Rhizobium sp. BK529]|uniref:hypothetical protein n=1 Tax=Rhizobium sp. BK529 TaxID=2586983 RepID=UPI00161B5DB3|nr:hypothetical protein [Rhizobium sp. BK529]MBB3593117.1 hypothetical protein [Rhizobium sp. BK529]
MSKPLFGAQHRQSRTDPEGAVKTPLTPNPALQKHSALRLSLTEKLRLPADGSSSSAHVRPTHDRNCCLCDEINNGTEPLVDARFRRCGLEDALASATKTGDVSPAVLAANANLEAAVHRALDFAPGGEYQDLELIDIADTLSVEFDRDCRASGCLSVIVGKLKFRFHGFQDLLADSKILRGHRPVAFSDFALIHRFLHARNQHRS